MEIILMALFQVKHFVFDFVLQTNAMVKDKGHLNKPGGYEHAATHLVGTLLIGLTAISADWITADRAYDLYRMVIVAAIYDGVSHYVIDYTKMRLGRNSKLTPADRSYWAYIGLDQLAHNMVYIYIILLWSK